MDIIKWCNDNTGFVSAILAALSLLLSLIAIIVAIRTARLPYKKCIKLYPTTDLHVFSNPTSGKVCSEIGWLTAHAVNLGSRNVTLTYLGFCVKDRKQFKGIQKISKIKETPTGPGMMTPTEIRSESFAGEDISFWLSKINKGSRVYLYAKDSEGKNYFKRIGRSDRIMQNHSR